MRVGFAWIWFGSAPNASQHHVTRTTLRRCLASSRGIHWTVPFGLGVYPTEGTWWAARDSNPALSIKSRLLQTVKACSPCKAKKLDYAEIKLFRLMAGGLGIHETFRAGHESSASILPPWRISISGGTRTHNHPRRGVLYH